MKIAILGGGSWGTALAVHLARNNHEIRIWEFFAEQAQKMQKERICPLLPEVKLAENIFISSNMEEIISGCELLFLVVPSDKVESTIKKAKTLLQSQPVIICSKGFGPDLKFLSDLVTENVSGEVYCLYGPTHAEEVCKDLFSGIVLAGKNNKEELKKIIASENFSVDLSEDLIGVQIAAALKNIVAVFAGILDGMGMGDNAKAFIITKGLQEIKEVGLSFGAKEETFSSLAGMGDLIVTCNSKHSRNRYVGEQIGKGKKLNEIITEMNMVAEGITTIKEAIALKEKCNLELPLISGIYQILFEEKDPQEVLSRL